MSTSTTVTLTGRQLDIVKLLAEGLTMGQIGTVLGLAHATVKTHLDEARTRVRASNVTHLVAISVREGWI